MRMPMPNLGTGLRIGMAQVGPKCHVSIWGHMSRPAATGSQLEADKWLSYPLAQPHHLYFILDMPMETEENSIMILKRLDRRSE